MPSMVGKDGLRDLFTACARQVAFAHCLSDAERRRSGVVLTLNASQMARDGLAAASHAFAHFAVQRGVRGEAAEALAVAMAQMAPTHVWWRPTYTPARPMILGDDDMWQSLTDLRAIAGSISALTAEPNDVRPAADERTQSA